MYELHKGDNAGWPYIYYDPIQQKKILAPEYGGDGKKTAGEDAIDPVVAFPGTPGAQWTFFTGISFRKNIKTVHLSPFMVHGTGRPNHRKDFMWLSYLLTMANHPANGRYLQMDFPEVPRIQLPGGALHRPCGLAQGLMVHFMLRMMSKELYGK